MAEQQIFHITSLPNGKKQAKLWSSCLQQSSEVTTALLALIDEEKDLTVIDLIEMNLDFGDMKKLAYIVFKFLIRSIRTENKNKVIINEKYLRSLRGKVSGLLFDNIKNSIGEYIELSDLETKLRICDFLNPEKITSDILGGEDIIPNATIVSDIMLKMSTIEASQTTSSQRGLLVTTAKQLIRKMKDTKPSESTRTNSMNNKDSPLKKHCTEESVDGGNNENSAKNSSSKAKKCYICKQLYSIPKKKKRDEIWNTYFRLCRKCGEFNYEKRNQKADLTNKYAVVTGGRIKIGFELVLKLLRDGCHVITTTRFPHDTSKRYAQQKDYEDWKSRLHVYALDLKDIPGIYKLIRFIKDTFPHLDILVNNAAQTIRRPMDFFRHLMDYECIPRNHVPEDHRDVLVQQDVLNYGYYKQQLAAASPPSLPAVEEVPNDESEPAPKRQKIQEADEGDGDVSTLTTETSTGNSSTQNNGVASSSKPELSLKRSVSLDTATFYDTDVMNNPQPSTSAGKTMTSCWNRDVIVHTGSAFSSMSRYFPRGATDSDGQQLDLRRKNSWRMVLEDVPVSEVVEILVVNVIAPFLLNKELKDLLCRSPSERRFIVNVSAMEGQFNRPAKTKFHPHTNMGKAALNMMTRTAALGYGEARVYMTAVDTGWVTDERPFFMARHEQRVKGFKLPLDSVDGAARIYHPIVHGLQTDNKPHFAVFLKDYAVFPW